MKSYRIKLLLATSIVPQVLLVRLISSYPEKVELYFSQTLYPFFFNLQQVFIKPIPFSIGDLAYLVLGIYFIYRLIRFLLKFRLPSKTDFATIAAVISIMFLLFQISWGLNYQRTPLEKKIHGQEEYSDSLLIDLTTRLVDISNSLHNKLSSSDSIAVSIPITKKEISNRIYDSFSDLQKNKVNVPKIKSSLFSLPLSYMGYGGYLNPFTLEAQVNMRIPKINLPVTIAHEMAHQLGYAAENEANFIGFLNAYENKDPYIQYAAILFAFRYCYSDLKTKKPEEAKLQLNRLNQGILKNFAESHAFWEIYKNPLEPFFKTFYDTYLKANGQQSGIKTYNQIVGFLIAYDQLNKFDYYH